MTVVDAPQAKRDAALHLPPREKVLSLNNVALTYPTNTGSITALENLTLSVNDGEFVSVLGPSGCGKSTLLKIIAGLLAPTSGATMLGGKAISGPRPDVGVVFQSPTLLPWKTVFDNVMVPIHALRLPVASYRERATELLRLVGLSDFMTNYPYELSGGMQQRVAIARGLVHDPKILLMDEPFAALDAMSREFMMDELQRIWSGTAKSVLFITHSIPEAVYLSDRVVTLSGRPGRVVDSREIPLSRPRDLKVMASKEFGDQANALRGLFDKRSILKGN